MLPIVCSYNDTVNFAVTESVHTPLFPTDKFLKVEMVFQSIGAVWIYTAKLSISDLPTIFVPYFD